jgi:hypothetical protein
MVRSRPPRRRVWRGALRRESPARRHRNPRLSTNRAIDISRETPFATDQLPPIRHREWAGAPQRLPPPRPTARTPPTTPAGVRRATARRRPAQAAAPGSRRRPSTNGVALVCSSSTASIRSGEVVGVGEALRDVAFSFPFDVGSCSVEGPPEVVVLDSGVCQVCSVRVDS